MKQAIEQIDIDVSEDGKDIILMAWTEDDRTFIASLPAVFEGREVSVTFRPMETTGGASKS